MVSPDSVERTQYLTRDRVHHLKEATPDKDRLFSKALREKMEEDLDERRRRRQQDSVQIESLEENTEEEAREDKPDDQFAGDSDNKADAQNSESAESDGSDATDDRKDDDGSQGKHIDVKA